MRLWTIQPITAYRELVLSGRLVGHPEKIAAAWDNQWLKSYNWLVKEARARGLIINKKEYPIWAWPIKPDMRRREFKTRVKSVLIEFEVSDSEILQSDFMAWHCVLNRSPYFRSNKEGKVWDDKEKTLSPKEFNLAVEKSWENIFSLKKDSVIQVITPELKTNQVKKVSFLK